MDIKFESVFLKAIKKKVDMIIENPVAVGEPLKGNWQGFYSCPVKRNFIIIYLYCAICRKKRTMPLFYVPTVKTHRMKL